jgi:hypothetical protein
METATPPDRLCTEKVSTFYNEELLPKVRVSINGTEHLDTVVEYCVSKGWARIHLKHLDGSLQKNVLGTGFRIKKVFGDIKVWWKE